MKLTPALSAELVELAAGRAGGARLTIAGRSMRPLLRAGMVVDVEPLTGPPRIGDVLVFRSQRGLIAHRVVGGDQLGFCAQGGIVTRRLLDQTTAAFVTCGDAHPGNAELVPALLVVGRVCAVWESAHPNARRIDDARYYWLGRCLARTRTLRSVLVKIRGYVSAVLTDPAAAAPPPAFSVLVAATHHFEHRRHTQGTAMLSSVPQQSIVDMSRRHHASGFISAWLDEAAEAGVGVPADLRDAFRRIRWTNAIQAGRVLACIREVRDAFVAAAIPHIFLKGGARLASDEPGADLQYSGDVDVLVPTDLADSALAALRAAGYREVRSKRELAQYASSHQREPLVSPQAGLPVEVHVSLSPASIVSQPLDYAALEPSSRRICGPVGEVCILDHVASAVHLAYHTRDLAVWRDIVLLSRLLRGFDRDARARFDGFVKAEKRDRIRLASAVAAADAVAFEGARPASEVRRYLAWAEFREDLPRRFTHTMIVEGIIGRCPVPELHIDRARPDVVNWLRIWARNLILLPSLGRSIRRHRTQRSRENLVR